MRLLMILFFVLISYNSYSQNVKLNSIHFKYGVFSSNNSGVNIEIIDNGFQRKEGKIVLKATKYSVKEKKDITKEYILSNNQYKEICNIILKVNPNEILTDPNYIVLADGDYTELFCTSFYGKVTYRVLHFDYKEKTSPSKDFIKAVKLILKYAEVEIYGINKFK